MLPIHTFKFIYHRNDGETLERTYDNIDLPYAVEKAETHLKRYAEALDKIDIYLKDTRLVTITQMDRLRANIKS